MSTAFTSADRELAAQAPPIQFKQLHPTFAAEASGVDFRNVTPAVVAAIKVALAKVSRRYHSPVITPASGGPVGRPCN